MSLFDYLLQPNGEIPFDIGSGDANLNEEDTQDGNVDALQPLLHRELVVTFIEFELADCLSDFVVPHEPNDLLMRAAVDHQLHELINIDVLLAVSHDIFES